MCAPDYAGRQPNAIAGFVVNMILFVAAMFIIQGLTYDGPSLREE